MPMASMISHPFNLRLYCFECSEVDWASRMLGVPRANNNKIQFIEMMGKVPIILIKLIPVFQQKLKLDDHMNFAFFHFYKNSSDYLLKMANKQKLNDAACSAIWRQSIDDEVLKRKVLLFIIRGVKFKKSVIVDHIIWTFLNRKSTNFLLIYVSRDKMWFHHFMSVLNRLTYQKG